MSLKTTEKNALPIDIKNESKENRTITPIEEKSAELLTVAEETERELSNGYNALTEAELTEELDRKIQDEISSYRRAIVNMLKAVQNTTAASDEYGTRWSDIKHSRKKLIIPPAPANAEIDAEETKKSYFAQGTNFYKLFLVCSIGSLVGVLLEVMWCLITNGYFESRSGLVYGPFNLLYGAGAVALTMTLYRFRNRSAWISFLGGAIVGSVLEYLCSWIQEMLIGSTSWDYSDMPFNINGRICLLYSVFWGVLGVLWIKSIYPRLAALMLHIPNKPGIIAVWVLIVFFTVNSIITCTTLFRWKQRIDNVPASNSFWSLVDDRFPDERMESIFANMDFGDDKDT